MNVIPFVKKRKYYEIVMDSEPKYDIEVLIKCYCPSEFGLNDNTNNCIFNKCNKCWRQLEVVGLGNLNDLK
jgi:hypothetical protein